MGGFFGVASKHDCVLELFYGVDYHSHLGTRRGGMAVYGKDGFNRAIHNIENSPFRTKFERDVEELEGNLGIGCISDYEPQPLLLQSHLGSFAITTIGKINNQDEILEKAYKDGRSHFLEMSGGQINATELIGSLICRKSSIVEGNPVCAGDGGRILKPADHDKGWHLCGARPVRKDSGRDRKERGRLLCIF